MSDTETAMETCPGCNGDDVRLVAEPTPHYYCATCRTAFYSPEQCDAYIAYYRATRAATESQP